MFELIQSAQDLPEILGLRHLQLSPVDLGHSQAGVWKLELPDGRKAYLKAQASSSPESFAYDRQVCLWLKGLVSVPEVLNYYRDQQMEYLLLSEIEGLPASDPGFQKDPRDMITALALSLRSLHALPIENCPLDQRLELKLKDAEQNLLAGRVDIDDFEPEHLGTSPQVLYQRLLQERPPSEDLVFSHGDACLPNFLIKDGQFAGFIDLGRAGIADRWQDLALVIRSLSHNDYPRQAAAHFLESYGIGLDQAKYNYYVLLDEFF